MGDPAPELDERLHAEAFKALLTGPLNGQVYDFDAVPGAAGTPGTLPDIYVTLSLSRRYVPAQRLSGQVGRTSWRLSTRFAGRDVDEARWAQLQIARAIDQQIVTIGTHHALVRLDEGASDAIEQEGPRWAGLSQWIYVI